MKKSHKLLTTSTICIAAFTLICASAYAITPKPIDVCASTQETAECFKVFVGDVSNAPEGYTQKRESYIKDTAAAKANTSMEAVVGFDDYYSVEEVVEWAEDSGITIERVYMWPKGETGRLALYVEDGDIEASIELYKQQVKENNSCDDPVFAKDYQRFLDGEYEVFAVTVTAPASALKAVSTEADCVRYVDAMYNVEAEQYARSVKKAVSYVELPAKPDGAL